LSGGSPSNVLSFSPDGKLLAARDLYDLRLWQTASGKEIRRLGRMWTLQCLAFSPDGKLLATGDDNIHLWRVGSGEEINPRGDDALEVTSVSFAAEGGLLATGGPDETIRVWDADSGKSVRRFKACADGNVAVTFSKDGKSLFSQHGDQIYHADEFFEWDAADGKERRRFPTERLGFAVTLSPSGRRLAWLDTNVALRVRDVASGKELRPWPWQKPGGIRAIHFSPRADLLAVDGLSGIRSEILDLATRQFYPGFEQEWDFAGFSPDGLLVARTDASGRIHFQETTTARDLACSRVADVLPYAGGGPRHLFASAFSPDGQTLATAMASEPIRLWETASGKERHRLSGAIGWLRQLAFSADGGNLVSVSSDKNALVWQLFGPPSGQRPSELSCRQLNVLWEDLANDDGRIAFGALRALTAAAPASVVDFLRRQGSAIPRLDPRRIGRRIAELDSDDFAVRERASAELEKLGVLAEASLRKALRDRPTLETRKRLELLLEKRKNRPISSLTLRGWRAVEVLEHLATPQALKLLEEWAKDVPHAQASLKRLTKKR
jgi:WD40 repeat protein